MRAIQLKPACKREAAEQWPYLRSYRRRGEWTRAPGWDSVCVCVCVCVCTCVQACCQHLNLSRVAVEVWLWWWQWQAADVIGMSEVTDTHTHTHTQWLSLNSPRCCSHDINPPWMQVYKYPPRWSTAQRTLSSNHHQLRDQNSIKKTPKQRRFKVSVRFLLHSLSCVWLWLLLTQTSPSAQMLCCRCVLPLLALYVSLEEISAAVLPSSPRNKRVGLRFSQIKYLQALNPVQSVL